VIGPAFLLSATACALVGLFYSFRPIRLKTLGLVGALIAASGYGLLAVAAGVAASGSRFSTSTLIFGIAMSFVVFGYEGIGHIIDYEEDKACGLNTFAVQLGVPRAVRVIALCQVVPVFLLCALRGANLLIPNMVTIPLILGVAVFSGVLMMGGRSEQCLCTLRIISVPLLSVLFFLLV